VAASKWLRATSWVAGVRGGNARPLVELGTIGVDLRHLDGAAKEWSRPARVRPSEIARSAAARRAIVPGRQRLRLAALGRRAVGGDVVRRERTRQLRRPDPSKYARRRTVPGPPVAQARVE
jgi:hypothetical protein